LTAKYIENRFDSTEPMYFGAYPKKSRFAGCFNKNNGISNSWNEQHVG